MTYRIHARLNSATPSLQICDASSGSVRMAWECPSTMDHHNEEESLLKAMEREEAIHDLFRRLFLITTEQYLKSDAGSSKITSSSSAKP